MEKSKPTATRPEYRSVTDSKDRSLPGRVIIGLSRLPDDDKGLVKTMVDAALSEGIEYFLINLPGQEWISELLADSGRYPVPWMKNGELTIAGPEMQNYRQDPGIVQGIESWYVYRKPFNAASLQALTDEYPMVCGNGMKTINREPFHYGLLGPALEQYSRGGPEGEVTQGEINRAVRLTRIAGRAGITLEALALLYSLHCMENHLVVADFRSTAAMKKVMGTVRTVTLDRVQFEAITDNTLKY